MSIEFLTQPSAKRRIDEACVMFTPLGEIHSRAQFGGYALYCKNIMFAMVFEEELYFRANKKLIPYFKRNHMQRFIYNKRGLPMPMQYYQVDTELWQNTDELLRLAKHVFQEAERDKHYRAQQKANRIKELPNLNLSIEKHLWRLNITTVEKLKQLGAREAYLALREEYVDLGLNLLLSLEGAISGCHLAAISGSKREELADWWRSLGGEKKPTMGLNRVAIRSNGHLKNNMRGT